MLWFFVAMMVNPSVLKRAQEEIDAVFGYDSHSIPGFVNMDDLPYCFALTKEVFLYVLTAFLVTCIITYPILKLETINSVWIPPLF